MSDQAASTLENIRKIEQRAKLAAVLGPEYRISFDAADVALYCSTARAVMMQSELATAVRKAMSARWALIWFAIGILVEAAAK
jgi:hypothetical protein